MEIMMNKGSVEAGNYFVQEELICCGIKLPASEEKFNFVAEPDNCKFIQYCLEILEKAKEFFVLVVDGIDIPAENRGDYQRFFKVLLQKEKLPIMFFTSDNILRGEDIFSDFEEKANNRKNIAVYIDERLRPSKTIFEPFCDAAKYPQRFIANEMKMICLET